MDHVCRKIVIRELTGIGTQQLSGPVHRHLVRMAASDGPYDLGVVYFAS
jgi:hypothetical protein